VVLRDGCEPGRVLDELLGCLRDNFDMRPV